MPKPGGNSRLPFCGLCAQTSAPAGLPSHRPLASSTNKWTQNASCGCKPVLPFLALLLVLLPGRSMNWKKDRERKNKQTFARALHKTAWGWRNLSSRPFDSLSWVFSVCRSRDYQRKLWKREHACSTTSINKQNNNQIKKKENCKILCVDDEWITFRIPLKIMSSSPAGIYLLLRNECLIYYELWVYFNL